VLGRRLNELRGGCVDPAALAITNRVSKSLADYGRRTTPWPRSKRYDRRGIDRHPGQSVEYVVADDDCAWAPSASDLHSRSPRNTTPTTTRRCSCGPARASSRRWGWDRTRIRRSLRDGRTVRLSTFVD